MIRVEQGKGRKDRYAMLSHDLLEFLRAWWRAGRAKGVMLAGGWLFGLDKLHNVDRAVASLEAVLDKVRDGTNVR